MTRLRRPGLAYEHSLVALGSGVEGSAFFASIPSPNELALAEGSWRGRLDPTLAQVADGAPPLGSRITGPVRRPTRVARALHFGERESAENSLGRAWLSERVARSKSKVVRRSPPASTETCAWASLLDSATVTTATPTQRAAVASARRAPMRPSFMSVLLSNPR